jgi:hypothetical protein
MTNSKRSGGLRPSALTEKDLEKAIAFLKERRTFDPGQRFGVYNLQRVYLDFLEVAGVREDRIPGARAEIVFYNLGKFSQVITDYEQIHFKSKPEEKYSSFVEFLRYQAPGYYPKGGQDAGLRCAKCRKHHDGPSSQGHGIPLSETETTRAQ